MEYPIWDKTQLLANLDGNARTARKMITLYFENLPRFLGQIERGIKRWDARAIEAGAHGLKGMSYNLFAPRVARLALELEEMGRQHRWEQVGTQHCKLKAALDELREQTSGLSEE